MDVFGVLKKLVANVKDGPFHGVIGIRLTRQDTVFDYPVKIFREGISGNNTGKFSPVVQAGNGHFVLGEGTGFIGTQHGGRTQCFNGCRFTGQNRFLRHSPGTESKEYSENHRKFLREHGHCECDPGEETF